MEFTPPAPAAPLALTSNEALTLAYLQSHEAPCPACGYNVHALTTPRCPECGRHLVLRIVSVDRTSPSWILTMVMCSIAAGVGLAVLTLAWHLGWPRWDEPEGHVLNIVLPFFLAMIPSPALMLMVRRRFGRMALPYRRVVAALVTIIITAMVLLFLLVFIW